MTLAAGPGRFAIAWEFDLTGPEIHLQATMLASYDCPKDLDLREECYRAIREAYVRVLWPPQAAYMTGNLRRRLSLMPRLFRRLALL